MKKDEKNHPKEHHNKMDGKKGKKHQKRGKGMESSSESSSESSFSEEMQFLPALPEDVQPLDLAYIPRASIDKRHGGRHLRRSHSDDDSETSEGTSEDEFVGKPNKGKKGKGKHGKGNKSGKGKHGKGGKKHGGHKGKNGEGKKHHGGKGKHGGKGHHGKGHHGGKGHHMKWCLAIGAILYTALITTFVCIYKRFVCAFRSYHSTVALQKQTESMTIEERNKAYLDMNSRCRW